MQQDLALLIDKYENKSKILLDFMSTDGFTDEEINKFAAARRFVRGFVDDLKALSRIHTSK